MWGHNTRRCGSFAGKTPFVPPAPTPADRDRTTIGGIGQWTTQLPRQPTKRKPYQHKRNMEARDRADIAQIVAILKASGIL